LGTRGATSPGGGGGTLLEIERDAVQGIAVLRVMALHYVFCFGRSKVKKNLKGLKALLFWLGISYYQSFWFLSSFKTIIYWFTSPRSTHV